jgi:FkbM family methyltransferase
VNNPFKPWYVYRPTQILRRCLNKVHPKSGSKLVALPWGGEIEIDAQKTIGASLINAGVYDLAVSELLWRLATPGDNVLDVGANVGYTTILLAARVGTEGAVMSFEPHPLLFAQLRDNVERQRKGRPCGSVVLRNCAVSDSIGVATLICPDEFNSNDGVARLSDGATSEEGIGVTTTTLDAEANDIGPCTLAKIDVEGHEFGVLKGASQLLEHGLRDIVFEDHVGVGSPVMSMLQARGFCIFSVGWTTRRVSLIPLGVKRAARCYEAPNYLATKNPARALTLCQTPGWAVLGSRCEFKA